MAQCRASNHRIFFGRHSLKWQSLALHQFAHAEDLKEFNTLWLVRGGTPFFFGEALDFNPAGERARQRDHPLLPEGTCCVQHVGELWGGAPDITPPSLE